jgi:2'-5' RNA ligase
LSALFVDLRGADPKTRWVNPANLHVTLKFIGNVATEALPSIERALAGLSVPRPFDIEFRALGFFPNERRPAVIWVGIAAAPELASLAAKIDEAVGGCGIARDTRPFAPHLTLARFHPPHVSAALRAQAAQSKDRLFAKQSVSEFSLMESKLKSTGAEYTTLRIFPLAAQGIVP